jgi:hypothetical protein
MTRATILCSLAILAAPLQAQSPPRDPTQLLAPAGSASISGVVVDADNKPVRMVAVRIEGDPRASRTVMTGEDGRFAFTRVPAGEFYLRAKKAAYPEVSYGAKRPGRAGAKLQIQDGTRLTDIVLKMERGAVLTGTVFNDRGQPVPDVSVSAYRVYTGLDGSFSTSSTSTGSGFPKTDDRGVYRFYGLPAGEYLVGTSPFFGSGSSARVPSDDEIREAFARAAQSMQPGYVASPKPQGPPPQQVDYAPVYFPDAPNAVDAARIKVSAGEERAGLDLHLVLRPMSAISGQVANAPDPKNVEMTLYTRAQGSALVTSANPDGSFNFKGLSAGDYAVSARSRGPEFLMASQEITLNGRDASGVTLTLAPPIVLSGRIVIQQNGIAPPPPFAQMRVNALPTALKSSASWTQATPAADGTFTLQGMIPGTYWIGLTIGGASGAPAPFAAASITIGSRDITDRPLPIAYGMPAEPVAITVTDQMPELSGHIMFADGKPATDYYVVAVAADQRYWLWSGRRIKSARPDANGRYVFANLPAGTYRIAATTDLENSDLSDRSFLEQILAVSAEVAVGPAEKKVFDLKVGGGVSPRSTPAARRRR